MKKLATRIPMSFAVFIALLITCSNTIVIAQSKCEWTEEGRANNELFERMADWFIENMGRDPEFKQYHQMRSGICFVVSESGFDSEKSWNSNKIYSSSPMGIDLTETETHFWVELSFTHPMESEDYITEIAEISTFKEVIDFLDKNPVRDTDIVLVHGGNSGSTHAEWELTTEVEEDFSGVVYNFEPKGDRRLRQFLREMSLALTSFVEIDGISYELDDNAKEALGEMLLLWELHFL